MRKPQISFSYFLNSCLLTFYLLIAPVAATSNIGGIVGGQDSDVTVQSLKNRIEKFARIENSGAFYSDKTISGKFTVSNCIAKWSELNSHYGKSEGIQSVSTYYRVIRVNLATVDPDKTVARRGDSSGEWIVKLSGDPRKVFAVNIGYRYTLKDRWEKPEVKERHSRELKSEQTLRFGRADADNELMAREVASLFSQLIRTCKKTGNMEVPTIPQAKVKVPRDILQEKENTTSLPDTLAFIKNKLKTSSAMRDDNWQSRWEVEKIGGCTIVLKEWSIFRSGNEDITRYTIPLGDLGAPRATGRISGDWVELRTFPAKASILKEFVVNGANPYANGSTEYVSELTIKFRDPQIAGQIGNAFLHAARLCQPSQQAEPF